MLRAPKLVVFVGVVAFLLLASAMVFAQDEIVIDDGILNNVFFGAGSTHVSLTMLQQNCPGFPTGTVCYFAEATAHGMGPHLGGSSGTYTISTAATGCSTTAPVGCAGPFSLTVNASGDSTVHQTAPILFSYTSPQGTLEGLLQFTTVSATDSHLKSVAMATFMATGGTFAPYFGSGSNATITFGLTFPLQLLWRFHGVDLLQIHPGTIVGNTTCTVHSANPSNFNGNSIAAGDYVWFNANFQVLNPPIADGTTLNVTNSTVSFSANGNNYVLPAPNSAVTFSSSASCISTTFDNVTQTFVTTVPLSSSDEVLMDGLSYQVPVPGLPGGINPVVWEGDFSSNVSGLQIEWHWGAAVYTQFTTDYNALGVKPGHTNTCAYNNSDHAGTPEGVNSLNLPWKNFDIGGARGGGGSNWTGSWSGYVDVTTCQ